MVPGNVLENECGVCARPNSDAGFEATVAQLNALQKTIRRNGNQKLVFNFFINHEIKLAIIPGLHSVGLQLCEVFPYSGFGIIGFTPWPGRARQESLQ